PHARTVLRLLSCFAPSVPIPVDLLQPDRLGGLLASAPESGRLDTRVEKALRGLTRLALIDRVDGQQAVMVHPVIADASRAHLRTSARADPTPDLVWRTAIRMVASFVAPEWPRPIHHHSLPTANQPLRDLTLHI